MLKLISRVWYFGISKSMLWLINFFLFDKSGARTLRMGCEQKFQSLNKIISKIFFSKIIFPKYPYKPYVTIKNIFGHIISHIFMFSTMFWVPGVTLLRLLRCTNKRHFDLSKEHSALSKITWGTVVAPKRARSNMFALTLWFDKKKKDQIYDILQSVYLLPALVIL